MDRQELRRAASGGIDLPVQYVGELRQPDAGDVVQADHDGAPTGTRGEQSTVVTDAGHDRGCHVRACSSTQRNASCPACEGWLEVRAEHALDYRARESIERLCEVAFQEEGTIV